MGSVTAGHRTEMQGIQPGYKLPQARHVAVCETNGINPILQKKAQ